MSLFRISGSNNDDMCDGENKVVLPIALAVCCHTLYLDVNCSTLRLYEMDDQGLPCKLRHSPSKEVSSAGCGLEATMWLEASRPSNVLFLAVLGRVRVRDQL